MLKGREFLDFGRGFYVTNIHKHAHRRTIHIALENTSIPIVTEFEYLENYPANVGLNVKYFYEASKEWIDFVIMSYISLTEIIHNSLNDEYTKRLIVFG
ncbi:MAG: DUF3990 domain-containing protein [Bacteroidales bacterium]|nr:DUF3990 domain-containing protein [Bacteroidales bacterium]